jgi:hypothetical protein
LLNRDPMFKEVDNMNIFPQGESLNGTFVYR